MAVVARMVVVGGAVTERRGLIVLLVYFVFIFLWEPDA